MNYTANRAPSQQGYAINRVLNAFETVGKVKQIRRDCYTAFNPLLPNQRTGSVSIRTDGSRVLVYDHAGHGTVEVLQAIGLSLTDLWDAPLTHHAPRSREQMSASTLLRLIRDDLLLVLCAMRMAINSEPIKESDVEQLNEASARIREALMFGGYHK